MKKLLVLVLAAAAALPASAAGSAEATPPTLTLRKSAYGAILFDGRGRVLYSFTRDVRGKPSRCYGDCAVAWPVYYAPKSGLTVGRGVQRSLLRTTKRRDGRLQVTYNGWPLYYYAHEKAGEVKCHNVRTHGGLWRVMRANGAAAP
jgi:predicted lipoprotein with Yx(FWY)xxD motif